MTDDPNAYLRRMLISDEGEVLHAYQDHLGFWTIGVGRLIDQRRGGGITQDESRLLLENDIRKRVAALERLPWWPAVADDEVRRAVLVAMAFQMGVDGLMRFRRTLQAVAEHRWLDAAASMAASQWATQTPRRAARAIEQMRTGIAMDYPDAR